MLLQPKKNQGDNIYEKKKSTSNPILAPKYQKNIISKIDFLVLIWAFDQNLWAFYWNWPNMSRKKVFGPKTSLFNIVKFGDIYY